MQRCSITKEWLIQLNSHLHLHLIIITVGIRKLCLLHFHAYNINTNSSLTKSLLYVEHSNNIKKRTKLEQEFEGGLTPSNL